MKVKSFILPVVLISIVLGHIIFPFRLNIVNLFKNPLSFFSSFKIAVAGYNQLLDENKKIKEENALLIKNQIHLEDLQRENAELKKLFNFKQASKLKLKGARVIGRDISGFLTSITIDKGLKNGVTKGMPVINNVGLVGRVVDVGQDTAQVLLITDSNLSVSAVIARNRAQGVITGGIGGYLIMKYTDDESITSGDKILTSNLSQIFPSGILIGEVIRVEKDLFNKEILIIVKPAVSLEKMETVFVVF